MVSIKTVREHSSDELLLRNVTTRINSVLPPGFTYLVDSKGQIIESVLRFLRKKCAPSGYLFSESTCRTYAEHLYEWFSLVETAGIPWYSATSNDLNAYSTALHERVSLHTQKRLRARTRKSRLRTIVSFYRSACDDGLIHVAPKLDLLTVPRDEQIVTGDLVEAERAVKAIVVAPFEHASCIAKEHLGSIFSRLGPTSSSAVDGYRSSCRDRLASELALHTGMRLDEVTSLRKNQILALVPALSRNQPCGLYITKTKRGNPRTVYLPSWLVSALQDYVDHERAFIVATAKSRANATYAEPPQLFLNKVDANKRDFGRKLTRTRLMAVFRSAVEAANILTAQVAFASGTGAPYLKYEPAYSFHNLRHTYAYTCYQAFLREGKPHPWRLVQHLLGHKNLQTTLDTYLAGADLQEAAVSDALVNTFHTWSDLVNATA
ncbi:site-specific recombinase XerD [Paraburkholderia sp. BL27I4N3]|uniref:tyrosine-type recombinase/integrase n=1 Tax=Paraburkholderia sp. BL27I4N3 TaxID=1938805 RepID=UPI000E26CDAA|nr:tyrosine-type recombinase/integrase [Paraburkholderia sp. BL27I4N3]REE17755.1 site-specific recombinase XerD [Paraburkholderia sp. BL27I4N3]